MLARVIVGFGVVLVLAIFSVLAYVALAPQPVAAPSGPLVRKATAQEIARLKDWPLTGEGPLRGGDEVLAVDRPSAGWTFVARRIYGPGLSDGPVAVWAYLGGATLSANTTASSFSEAPNGCRTSLSVCESDPEVRALQAALEGK